MNIDIIKTIWHFRLASKPYQDTKNHVHSQFITVTMQLSCKEHHTYAKKQITMHTLKGNPIYMQAQRLDKTTCKRQASPS